MNFYCVLCSHFDELKHKIMETPYSRVVYKVAMNMYQIPHLFNPLQRAWAFYVLTNMGFSGTYSFGCYTKGKRAQGWERKKALLDQTLLDRLKGVQIECTDALRILTLRDAKETFHYVDPPYFNSNMGIYGGYTETDFKNLLDTLFQLKGKFLLSSYPSDLLTIYTQKYGWYTKTIQKTVSVNQTKTRKPKQKIEVLTANYPI